MSSFVARVFSTAALVLAAALAAGSGPPADRPSDPQPGRTPAVTIRNVPDDLAPDDVQPGQRSLAAVAAPAPAVSTPPGVFSYYFVPGTAFRPRNSGLSYTYQSYGCVSIGAGGDRILNTDLHLPNGSAIKYLRLYYDDTDATYEVTGWLTKYNGSVTTDVVNVSSTGSAGKGYIVSTLIADTFDEGNYGYMLLASMGSSTSTNQICGLRVAYYAPPEGHFTPIAPCRLVDTRAPVFPAPLGGGWLPAATERSYTITNVCGLPVGATSVSLNATVTSPAGPGFLVLYPQGGSFPPVSTLNFLGGDTIVNSAIVPISATGGITMALGVSGGHVILDINGYYY